MTEKEILRKVIEKAVKNGYKDKEFSKNFFSGILDHILEPLEGERNGLINANRYYALIFDVGFAKAFFPTISDKHRAYVIGVAKKTKANVLRIFDWKWHLQQMVLEPEPLDYLKKFL